MFCTDVEMKVTTMPHGAAISQIVSCGSLYQVKISLNTARDTIDRFIFTFSFLLYGVIEKNNAVD